MGFGPERVDWALQSTKGQGGNLTAALDHLEAHQEEDVPANWREQGVDGDGVGGEAAGGEAAGGEAAGGEAAGGEAAGGEAAGGEAAGGEAAGEEAADEAAAAKSIRCNECQKQFRDMDLAMYHAEKSGHEDFAESADAITPLTDEQKQERLALLRARLAEKRSSKEKEDEESRRANEMIRRKAGQDASEVQAELEKKERAKDAERKRREKRDEAEAKARVRAQIEEDKRARADKAAREKALREGKPEPGAAPSAQPTSASAPRNTSTADETRLRVRSTAGNWTAVLNAAATLADVERTMLRDGHGQGASALEFSTTFPRKAYTGEEMSMSLRDLGLVPSAALEAKGR
ncbi:hypothetical protein MSPP1_000809 [Malassezia sp. CBS 17886]|nr:hypothetical protein MSPP1_000809 [Malassezia sp. CBS 17886]